MGSRPLTPRDIEMYRRAISDAKNLVSFWAGNSRYNARKLKSILEAAVINEAADQLERILPVLDTLAAAPTKPVDFDEEPTNPDIKAPLIESEKSPG